MSSAPAQAHQRVLVVDGEVPRPDQDAGSERLTHLLGLLRGFGAEVDFAALHPAAPPAYVERLAALGVRLLPEPAPAAFGSAGNYAAVLVCRAPVAEVCLPAARARWPQARLVFDTVDLHHVRLYRAARLVSSASLAAQALHMRRVELEAVRHADVTLVVSEAERAVLCEAVPGSRVLVVSNVHPLPPPGPPAAGRAGLLFVGSWRHWPNLDAAEFLVRQVLPPVRARLGTVPVYLVGAEPPERIRTLAGDGVSVTGYLSTAKLEALYHACRVSVAPLRAGAGVKGKVLSSLSHGLPVVTTPIGAEGMGASHGQHLLVADGAPALAAAVAQLYTDAALWARLAEGGRQLVAERFSPALAAQGLRAALTAEPLS